MNFRTAIATACAAGITEADEANPSGDPLVAAANLAFQVAAGESAGVIGLYEEAALRCGMTPTQVAAVLRDARDRATRTPPPSSETMMAALSGSVLDYLKTGNERALRERFPMLS